MPSPSRLVVPGYPHHITQRGVRSMEILKIGDTAGNAPIVSMSREHLKSSVPFKCPHMVEITACGLDVDGSSAWFRKKNC